jgi:glycosyltransferase involved in cell wall biosynthesis
VSRPSVTVSIITPTLNGAAYLQECANSVAAQRTTGIGVEHLVVDDGSTDGTLDIAERNGCQVIQGRRAGLYDAMNLGIESAGGQILGVLGSDDLLAAGALRRVVDGLASSRRPWVVGGIEWIDANGSSLGYIGPPPPWMTTHMFASLGWNCIHHQATFMTREFLNDLGGYDAAYRIAGDYEFLARALQRSRFVRSCNLLAYFRRHGLNLSMSPLTAEENRRVAALYGPPAILRPYYRQTLRVWLNARHPRWWQHKRSMRHAGGASAASAASRR